MKGRRVSLMYSFLVLMLMPMIGVSGPLVAIPGLSAPPSSSSTSGSTLTIHTNQPQYIGNATIIVSGTVSPVPSIPSNVTISITNPANQVIVTMSSFVSNVTGGYSSNIQAGCPYTDWFSGNYQVMGVWQSSGQSTNATMSFQYLVPVGGGGGQAYHCASSSSSSTTTANAPEFGTQVLSLVAFVSVAAAALLTKGSRRPMSPKR